MRTPRGEADLTRADGWFALTTWTDVDDANS